MEDLCAFAGRDDLPPVVQAAVVHAQFETIHPFPDGNGRVGRALIHVVLRRRGLTPRYVPPVSLILATNGDEYVRGLTMYRDSRVAEWCGVFAGAVRLAALESVSFANSLSELQTRWMAAAGNPRKDSSAAGIIAFLPAHPILTVATAQTLLGRSKQAANEAMSLLESAGVLRQISIGKRNRAWEAVGLFDLINGFERMLATPHGEEEPSRAAPMEHAER
jgi:Fic family protein